MKILKLLLITTGVLLTLNTNAQEKGKWMELNLNGIGSFSYPTELMEIQNAALKAINDSIRASYTIDVPPSKLTLQQTGLNSGENYKYARVIVEVYNGSSGDYLNKSTKLSSLSSEEKKQIKESYKESVAGGYKAMGIEIVKWYPVELVQIDDQFVVHLHWVRKSTVRKGNVDIHLYCFVDDDREIDLTLSCREVNVGKWEKVYSKIANSFKVDSK